MKINTEQIFNAIWRCQYDAESRAKNLKKRGFSSQSAVSEFNDWTGGLAKILGIDPNKLLCWYRGIKKWHDKRGWRQTFPFEKNHERTLEYLKKEKGGWEAWS